MTSIRSMLKIFIILSFIAIQYRQTGAAKQFTTNEYIGEWEDVASIRRSQRYAPILCQRRNVTKADDGHVVEEYSFIFRGNSIVSKGSVDISNSEMVITYPGAGATLVYEIECYDDCNDLILIKQNNQRSSVLVSRNFEASAEAIVAFKKLAESLNGFVHYNDNRFCDAMIK